jgi:aminoglycoside phosphotransferase (APT) family kinase protein
VPSPLGPVDHGGLAAIVTTAVPGKPMSASYLRRRHTGRRGPVTDDFQAALDWLAELHRATAGAAAPIDRAAGLAARLRRRFPDDERQDELAGRLAELDSRLGSASTPRTAVHGDYWFGNLLLDRGRVSGVVDWESGAVSGEPVRDLARFALSYALYLDRGTRPGRRVRGHRGLRAGAWGEPVAFALEGSGWFPRLFRGFLEAGLSRLGAPASLWREVALAGIAELALRSDDDEFARAHLDLFQRLAAPTTKGITT